MKIKKIFATALALVMSMTMVISVSAFNESDLDPASNSIISEIDADSIARASTCPHVVTSTTRTLINSFSSGSHTHVTATYPDGSVAASSICYLRVEVYSINQICGICGSVVSSSTATATIHSVS